jgi:hypothetical protein
MQGITLFDASVDIAGARKLRDLKANHTDKLQVVGHTSAQTDRVICKQIVQLNL